MNDFVFLDTVGLVAVWNRRDQWHQAAKQAFTQLITGRVHMVTTSYVLLECGNASARHPFRSLVLALRAELLDAGALLEPTIADCEQAWAAYQRGEANNAGIVDHVSFVIMRRLGLTRAFTNDAHFRAAGFETMF
jgi:predicted nucleic acid-binding protein